MIVGAVSAESAEHQAIQLIAVLAGVSRSSLRIDGLYPIAPLGDPYSREYCRDFYRDGRSRDHEILDPVELLSGLQPGKVAKAC